MMNDTREKLLTIASNIPVAELQEFYDNLDEVATNLHGGEIAIGRIATEILEISRERGHPIKDWFAPPPHGENGFEGI